MRKMAHIVGFGFFVKVQTAEHNPIFGSFAQCHICHSTVKLLVSNDEKLSLSDVHHFIISSSSAAAAASSSLSRCHITTDLILHALTEDISTDT